MSTHSQPIPIYSIPQINHLPSMNTAHSPRKIITPDQSSFRLLPTSKQLPSLASKPSCSRLQARIVMHPHRLTSRTHSQATHELESELILRKVLQHYATDEADDSGRSAAERNRDLALEVASDSSVVAPLVATANLHSRANPKSYMYVFSHPRSIRDKSAMGFNVSSREHYCVN